MAADREVLIKLAKLLRMLTSSHDGEVLAAANRLNGIVAAHDIDWDAALSAQAALTKEDMQKLYDTGYQRGLAEGAANAKPAPDDWAPAGTSRTDEVGAQIKEVETIIGAAVKAHADGRLSEFERSFSKSMSERMQDWGRRAFVSEKQWGVLNRLKNKLEREGYL